MPSSNNVKTAYQGRGHTRASSRAKSAKARAAAITKSRAAKSSAQSRRTKYNSEIKFKEVLTHLPSDLSHHEGSELLGPANSLILLNGLFGGNPTAVSGDAVPGLTQGVGNTAVVGNWITPAYADSMKCTLDYSTLAETDSAMNVRQVTGFIKNTGNKVNATLTNPGDWLIDIYKMVKKELFESEFSADFLSFSQKSRMIEITSSKMIIPKKAQLVASGTSAHVHWCPPSQVYTKHQNKAFKQRLTNCTDEASVTAKSVVPHDSWIPFTMFLAPELSAASSGGVVGKITVKSVTKAWFRDA
jgi:hypothetical protein